MLHFLTDRNLYALLVAVTLCATHLGCNSSTLENESQSDASNTEAGPQSDSEADSSEPASQSEEESADNLGDSAEDSLSYVPPFPERLDLFVPSKRERQTTRTRTPEGNVELIGFATVEGREVVLSIINGSVYSLAEGDIHSGVEVISIKQPAVVLQRGREKWQVSLHN